MRKAATNISEQVLILMESIKCWRCALQLTQSHKPESLFTISEMPFTDKSLTGH